MTQKIQNRIIEEIVRDLFSENDTVVFKALNRCREHGNVSLVEPLIFLFARTESELVKKEVADILGTLKISNTEETFKKALSSEILRPVRKNILSFMWNSGVQPLEFMGLISAIAVEGSLEETIECLTLLDTIDEGIPEEQLLDSIATVREYIGDTGEKDQKYALLVEYLSVLESMREY
ncbi:MAG: hypothetical protein IT223_04675 [Crocinitomicaceae bacterium]|nr:hypothetical protein [Crocinitomicaceae bacterium]